MSEQSENLRQMNLEIQQEQAELQTETALLKDRKKALKNKEHEYLVLSLEEFESK